MKMHIKDLRFDTFKAGVGDRACSVRVTHLPTGFSATCDEYASELKNRKKAMKMLSEVLKGVKK